MVSACRVSLNATCIHISSFLGLLTDIASLIRATVIAIWFRLPIMGWWRIVSNNHCNNFLLDFKKRNRKPNTVPIRLGMIIKAIITIIIMVNQLTNGAALKGIFHRFKQHLNKDFVSISESLNNHHIYLNKDNTII